METGSNISSRAALHLNGGSAQIVDVNNFVTVSHGLGRTPTWVSVTAKEPYGNDFCVTNINSSSFQIYRQFVQFFSTNYFWVAGV